MQAKKRQKIHGWFQNGVMQMRKPVAALAMTVYWSAGLDAPGLA